MTRDVNKRDGKKMEMETGNGPTAPAANIPTSFLVGI